MQEDHIPPFDQTGTPGRVCIADGHGVKIRVERRHLVVEDGIGRSRRERRFHKATSGLKRVVVLGTTGYVSLEAVRWLTDANIPLIQIDPEGRLLTTSQPMGSDRAALRRAQALALTNDTGLQVVRFLLDRKLEGQAHIAAQLGGSRIEIDEANRALEQATTVNELMWLEAQAANHYWHAWTDVECRFITRDQTKIPNHWRTFGKRASRFGGSGSHNAANPTNAILNYLYALLEAEAVIASQTVGLDPGIGILHVDKRARDSFALDLMEPVRPWVDQWVLHFLARNRFKASDFVDTRRGTCRLKPTITHWLAETTSEWATAVAPHAEEVAKILTATSDIRGDRIPKPPPGFDGPVVRPPERSKPTVGSVRPSHCHTCGDPIPLNRAHCDTCLPHVKEEQTRHAHSRLKELREGGNDPAHGGDAALKRGQSVGANNRRSQEWNRNNDRLDPDTFTRQILPLLQEVPLSVMADATGLSKGYCSFIKRGIKIPHERHWTALEELGQRRT